MKTSVNYFLKNRNRNISLIFGVFISTILLIVIYIVNNTIQNHEINNLSKNIGSYNFKVDGLDEYTVDKISSLDYIDHVGTDEFIGSVESKKGTYQKLTGIGGDYFKLNGMDLISGHFPHNNDEIVVENWVAENLDIKIGDSIELNLRYDEDDYFKKEGFKVVGVLTNNNYFKQKGYMHLYTRHRNLKKILTYISVLRSKNLSASRKSLSKFININPEEIKENKILNDVIRKNNGLSITELISCIGVLLVIVLFISGVYNISIIKRRKDFGIFKTLGITNKKMFLVILLELLIISLLGSFLGMIFGLMIVKILRSDTYILSKFFGVGKNLLIDMDISQVFIGKKIIFYILIPNISVFIVSLIQYRAIKKLSPLNLINYNELDYLKLGKGFYKKDYIKSITKKVFKCIKEINLLDKIIFNRIYLYKLKSFLIIFTLSLGSIIFIITNYRNDLMAYHNDEVLTSYSSENRFDIKMSIADFNKSGISESKLNRISKLKEYSKNDSIKEVVASSQKMGRLRIFSNYEKYKDYLEKTGENYDLYKGILIKDRGEIYVKSSVYTYNDEVMRLFGLDNKIDGAVIYLPEKFDNDNTFFDSNKNIEFISSIEGSYTPGFIYGSDIYNLNKHRKNMINIDKVTRIYIFSGLYYTLEDIPQIIVTNSLYKKLFGELRYDSIEISLNSGIDADNVTPRILKEVEDDPLIVSNIYEMKKQNKLMSERINLFSNFIVLIIFILALINAINMISDIIFSQKDEIDTMKILGANRKRLKYMCLKEVIFYTFISYAVTFIVGVFLEIVYYITHFKNWYFPDFYLEFEYFLHIAFIYILVILYVRIFVMKKVFK